MSDRTPDQIRDESMERFNAIAPVKYDIGQREHGGLLENRVLKQRIARLEEMVKR